MDEPLETEHADIRESVRARYAAAATRFAGGEHAQAGAVEASCCGAAPVATTDHGDAVVFGAVLYDSDDGAGAPEAAVAALLGCGVPTAVADLHSGEIVLDLGSGAGADVLISARRLAPDGRAIGLDMTVAMLDLARRNAAEAGVSNVEFVQGYLEHIPLPDASVEVVISTASSTWPLTSPRCCARPPGCCALAVGSPSPTSSPAPTWTTPPARTCSNGPGASPVLSPGGSSSMP